MSFSVPIPMSRLTDRKLNQSPLKMLVEWFKNGTQIPDTQLVLETYVGSRSELN